MNLLYIDCGMGAAGDMLTSALLELMPNPQKMIDRLNALSVPHVRFSREMCEKCGILGTQVTVTVDGAEEDEHMHSHAHSHPHGTLHTIEHIVNEHLPLPDCVKKDILAVYALLAEAESSVHGVPISDIHFHEVGTMDALADITAVCLLMHELHPDKVVASAVHVGCGTVRCAHGILPVPAPATASLLREVPIYGGSIQGELCTPTGAALLRYFVDEFGTMPIMRTRQIGYGMGKKDFAQANCVRVLLGESDASGDTVAHLSCNLDDMTAEDIGFATERLLAAGALEVYTVPAGMKKNRPGTLLCVLCAKQDAERMAKAILKYTTTIGVRETETKRYTLSRRMETLQTPYGPVRCKVSEGYGVKRRKWEHDDLCRIAEETGETPAAIRGRLSHFSDSE